MQTVFPAWCSDPFGTKMGEKQSQKLAFSPLPAFMKRKRVDSFREGNEAATVAKKARSDESPRPTPARLDTQQAVRSMMQLPPEPGNTHIHGQDDLSSLDVSPGSTAALSVKEADATASAPASALYVSPQLSPLQQVIENEFNMQILMKHNELRLIEQELAKCQVALEQLRRCELRPYPGNEFSPMSEPMSTGTGSAVSRPGFTQPAYGAAYGVVDGPYTKHYRRWLVPDVQFDSISHAHAAAEAEALAHAGSRSTRYTATSRKSTGKVYSRHDSLNSLPTFSAPAPVKDKNQPQFLRRSTDGALVKLVCNNCHRWNFSSIQGFLNHCRIAHKVDYKSHDAAAIDCGQIPDEGEAVMAPPETPTLPVPKPIAKPVPAPAPHVKGQVHPFNTANAPPIHDSAQTHAKACDPVRRLSNVPAARAAGTPFKPSKQLPRLSEIFARNGLGGDLEQAAAAAKQRIDFSLLEDDSVSPSSSIPSSPAVPLIGMRTVAGAGIERPSSRKGIAQSTQQRRRPAPLAPASAAHATSGLQDSSEIPESPLDSATNLSPHTADSAPGLVSDNDDEDHASASEDDEAPHTSDIEPPLRMPSAGCTAHMDHDPHHLEISVEDDMHDHGVVIHRADMLMHDIDDHHRNNAIRAAGSPSRKLAAGAKK